MRQLAGMRDDRGFTISEVIVVTGLLGFILAAAWAGMSAASKAGDISQNATTASHDLSIPLEQITKIVMQNNNIKSAQPNRLDVWDDRNLDNLPELDAFYVDSSGNLVWESWFYNSSRTAYTKHTKWVMSSTNANGSKNIPLFTYYDPDGNQITDMSKAPSYTRTVKVRLEVQLKGQVVESSRLILLRNRS